MAYNLIEEEGDVCLAMSAKHLFVGVALLPAFMNPSVVRGQSSSTCDEGKPFTAQMVEHLASERPDRTESRLDSGGLRARDSSGRTYAESVFKTNQAPPKTKSESVTEGVFVRSVHRPEIQSIISVSNCHTGEDITIFPDLKIFRVVTNRRSSFWKRNTGASLFDRLASGPRRPNATIEDLGFKEIEGVLAHGYRETITGTEDDGDWNGKTEFVTESWISDDLAEIIQRTISNFKIRATTTMMLTGIKREEPPETLFAIPSGYKAELPTDKKIPSGTPQSKPEN